MQVFYLPGKAAIKSALASVSQGQTLDPQGSLTRLCERRRKQEGIDKNNPMLLDGVGNIQEAVVKLKRTGFERELLLIDTPGSMMPLIRAAIGVADCIILPLQASLLDIEAQEDAAEAVNDASKLDRLLVVLTRVDARVGVDDAVNLTTRRFGKAPLQIRQRVAYARAHIAGRTGAEFDKECARETAELWAAVRTILRS